MLQTSLELALPEEEEAVAETCRLPLVALVALAVEAMVVAVLVQALLIQAVVVAAVVVVACPETILPAAPAAPASSS